ncbi:MAG: amidophosphoribosyltransferase [bacterium]
MSDEVFCECGLFGIFGDKRAAEFTYLGLYSLQHRGQEAAGIVSSDGDHMFERRGLGEVSHVFADPESLQPLIGDRAIGHNRYSTTGASALRNVQPMVINYKSERLAAAHNGNLTNSEQLRTRLEKAGAIFQSTSDTEEILHLMARSRKQDLPAVIADALRQVRGAYSILFLTNSELVAARDPRGFRPLAIGKRRGAWIVASETCAFDIIGAKYIRDVEPGEIIRITKDGLESHHLLKQATPAPCIFEYIYFSRPDSKIFGENVDKVRRRLGRRLAREHPVEADLVMSVPDSSNTATLGYSEESGIRFEIGLIRNHYVGRTFIDPDQQIRDLDVKVKFNAVRGVLQGKRVVVVDDSIVRGTTMKKLIKMIREAGAKEIHLRISSPPIISPCFYGIDMPTKKELIASSHTVEQTRKALGVDTLGYLSLEGMLSLKALPKTSFCTACFSGKYPEKIVNANGKLALEVEQAKEKKVGRRRLTAKATRA